MTKTLLRCLFAFLLSAPFAALYAQLPPPCPNGTEPAEDCESACISCDFNGFQGSTAGWAPGSVPSFCSMIQNDQWIGFIAGANSATFTVTPSNCTGGNGVQVALYSGCGEPFITCNAGNQGNGNVPATITAALTPGTNYYLLIDGYSGDECDFTISVSPPTALEAQPLGPLGSIGGPSQVCPGATATYTVPNVSNAGGYTWTAPPGALINNQPSGTTFDAPAGHTVDITFGTVGGTVCVEAANSCFEGGLACKNVQVVPILTTNLPIVKLCSEDLPYGLPWGDSISISGTYTHVYSSFMGCDSLVRQQVSVWGPYFHELAPKTVCKGSCVTVCGEDFCATGHYQKVCTTAMGCDSTLSFMLTVLNPVAKILGDSVLSCANGSITLGSAPSAPGTIKSWKKPDGTVLAANAGSLVVDEAGTYILTSTQQQGGVLCSAADTLVVTASFTIPTVSASVGDSLTCQQPSVQLLGSSMTSGAGFAWSGPNGFASTVPSPFAYAPGTYTLVVTHPLSHCTATASVEVLAEANLPALTATGGSLTCIVDSIPLSTATTASAPTFAWTGPNGFSSSQANPIATVAGTYFVTVTDSITGCMAIATATVLDHTTAPTATAQGGSLTCAQPGVTLSFSTTAVNPIYQWLGPGGFISGLTNPTVLYPGIYTLILTDGNAGCNVLASAQVTLDTLAPGVTAVGGLIGCAGLPINLQGSSPTSGATFHWIGPGFSSNLPNPQVQQPGTYTLLVTAPNGCTSMATTVVGQLSVPVIANPLVTNDQNSQGVGAIQITVTGVADYTVLWYLNGQLFADVQNLADLHAGVYVAIVNAANGCADSLSVTVDNVVPTVEPAASLLWEISPNPASSFLEVRYLGDGLSDTRLELFDMLGRKVRSDNMGNANTRRLEVKNLPAGQYELMIRNGRQSLLRPVVIQR